MSLAEKYRPKSLNEVKGQLDAIEKLKIFFRQFPKKKAVCLYGPPGTGKTTIAHAFANDLKYEIIELNASDLRNKEQLDKILKPASEQQSLFKKSKLILVDEVDGIAKDDRGGLPELISIIEKSSFPIILTANDIWNRKFSLLRNKCVLVLLKDVQYRIITELLAEIAKKEDIQVDLDIIKSIAVQARGDIRASLNDLQSIKDINTELSGRDKEEDIFNILRIIFKNNFSSEMLSLLDKTSLTLDEILLWIEENIPQEYNGQELARAYEMLSLADVFRGRIYRQQHWRFLVYQNMFLSAGIASAKNERKTGFTSYKKPTRILKIWMANQKHAKKKSIAEKYSSYMKIGKKRAIKEFPIISLCINDIAMNNIKLNEEEKLYLQEYQKNAKERIKNINAAMPYGMG